MDHREPPPPLGLPAPGGERPDRPRILARLAWILAALAIGSWALFFLARSARNWLAAQAAYQISFRSIELIPPPPSWYRGGPEGFLEALRRRARMPETIPLLATRADEIARVFEGNSPWVAKVDRVYFPPMGLAVTLRYREPAALVKPWDSDRLYLVDASAILLPPDDLDEDLRRFAEHRGLVTINGPGLSTPREPRVGHRWELRPGAAEVAPGNSRIEAAARLAAFLRDRMKTIDRAREPALGIRYINPMDPANRGLFLKNDLGASILWGDAPGDEPPGQLSSEEKWEKWVDWSRKGPIPSIPEADYWEIRPTEVLHRHWKENPAPKSVRSEARHGDRGRIPRIASGQSGESTSY